MIPAEAISHLRIKEIPTSEIHKTILFLAMTMCKNQIYRILISSTQPQGYTKLLKHLTHYIYLKPFPGYREPARRL